LAGNQRNIILHGRETAQAKGDHKGNSLIQEILHPWSTKASWVLETPYLQNAIKQVLEWHAGHFLKSVKVCPEPPKFLNTSF